MHRSFSRHLWLVLRYAILNLEVIQAAISLAKQEGLLVSLDLASFEAGALVHVYTDGTVLVAHEGVEMGQGLHTKVAQITASAFNILLSSVFISDTSTNKVPNSSPTAEAAVLICMEQRF
ncbi:xanthine dehydrogenase 2-like isoform X2 [Arachis hypogaea]|uniref:xanthine dehydrogenase 2-like isoform X2 n=1 Tax=Arachis hypogaea TaxID=3818 RepID=UPI0034E6439B|nr:Xanthine dehydrogenase [Arachis hypogaea]